MMKEIKYLITYKESDTLCENKDGFISLLNAHSYLNVNNDKILLKHKNKEYECSYEINTDRIKNINNREKNENYRYILITIRSEDDKNLSHISRSIKKAAYKINPNNIHINTLWDDIGRSNTINLFPLLNEVENLMRYLISQFMIVNIGTNWSINEIDKKVTQQVESSDISPLNQDDLFKVNFRHLSDILFNEVSRTDTNTLIRLLKKTKFDENDKKTIMNFIPSSNWDRYFKEYIDVDRKTIEENWENLSVHRNHVAHNRNTSQSEYDKIKKTCEYTIKIIREAIGKLESIKIADSDKKNTLNKYADISSDQANASTTIFWIVNSNQTWSDTDYLDMYNRDRAAAYHSRKSAVENIKKGNVVYLYHNKVGIFSKGTASDNYLVKDKDGDPNEEYYIPLSVTWKVNPVDNPEKAVHAWEINQALKSGHRFRQTAFTISKEMAEIIDNIIENKLLSQLKV